MSLKACFIAAISLGLGLVTCCPAESTVLLSRYASTLYSFTYDFERDPAWQRRHRQALNYIHVTSHPQLALDLCKVLKLRSMNSTAGAGAAYLMVLHDIDRRANLQRLEGAHGNKSEEVERSLPDALADIAIRIHSREAARFLVAMPNGEWDCEGQAEAIHRLFLASPELVVSVVSKSPGLRKNFLELLPFESSMVSARRIALNHLKQSKGTELEIYRKISHMKDWPE